MRGDPLNTVAASFYVTGGILQRWLGALQEVVLKRCPGRIVLFLGEIDAVCSLSFSTDEFFAAIRECYGCRGKDRAFDRHSFPASR